MRSRATHGAAYIYVGKDGIKRELVVTRYDDESIQMDARTWWDGGDKEPLSNGIRMGVEAFNALAGLIDEFTNNRDLYAIKLRPEGNVTQEQNP